MNTGRQSTSWTYIDDATQRPNRVGTIYDLRIWLHIFHDTACDHDDVLCRNRQLFDGQVNHLTQGALVKVMNVR